MGFWRIPYSPEIIFNCDDCGEEFDTAEKDFQVALQLIRESGWSIERHPDGWMHFCQDCANAMYGEMRHA